MIRSDKSYADQLVDLKVFQKIHISKKDELEDPIKGYHMTKQFLQHIEEIATRLAADPAFDTLRMGEGIISILINHFNQHGFAIPSDEDLEAMGINVLRVWIHQFHLESETYTDKFGNVRLKN